jgi:hypothetical protein
MFSKDLGVYSTMELIDFHNELVVIYNELINWNRRVDLLPLYALIADIKAEIDSCLCPIHFKIDDDKDVVDDFNPLKSLNLLLNRLSVDYRNRIKLDVWNLNKRLSVDLRHYGNEYTRDDRKFRRRRINAIYERVDVNQFIEENSKASN